MLIHRNAQFEYVQTIYRHNTGRGGYTNFVGQDNVNGGMAGADVELSLRPYAVPLRMFSGDCVEWWEGGEPVYIGRLTADPDNLGDSWRLNMTGAVADYFSRAPADISFTNKKASEVLTTLIGTYLTDDPLINQSTRFIETSSYTVAPTITFANQKWIDILTSYNQYEGAEWGGSCLIPGFTLNDKTLFYYRAANKSTLNYIIDASRLKNRPIVSQDREAFANQLRVRYGNSGAYLDVAGTSESQSRFGKVWKTIDLSGDATTSTDATQAANAFYNGIKIDGVETPPVSVEIILDYDSRIRPIFGQKNIMRMKPGINVLLTGTQNMPRTLDVTDSITFIHITDVRWGSAGEVALKGNRIYDPAVLLAILKAKAA